MSDSFDGQLHQRPTPHPQPPIRQWWDTASEADQDAVLANLGLCRGMAGVPFAFLPDTVQTIVTQRLRVKPNDEG